MDWLWLLVGYLFGSTPTGYLTVKIMRGEDIRNFGSGNIGATNVGRVMGKPWAIAVAIFDMLKGGIAVGVARLAGVHDPSVLALVGLAGVLGHNFPVWLRFKGGKGVATSFGVLFFFHPAAALLGGIVWYVTMRVTRYVSVASMLALATGPVWLIVVAAPLPFVVVAVLFDVLTIIRHRTNIRRLLAGTESKVGQKKPEASVEAAPEREMPVEGGPSGGESMSSESERENFPVSDETVGVDSDGGEEEGRESEPASDLKRGGEMDSNSDKS